MLLNDFALAIDVDCSDRLIACAVEFAKRLEFETVTVMAALDRVGDKTQFSAVDNVTCPAARALQDNPQKGPTDPVMQHCKTSHLPIVWDRATYERVGKVRHWEEQAMYGFCTGIAVAAHLPKGRHLMIGVDRDRPLPKDVERITFLVAQLQLFVACALDSSIRVLLGEPADDRLPTLTVREMEAMRWTMEGKTAWEVGRILGISEQTAARHLNNATQKLGCSNKMQAIVKALRLQLID